MHAPEKIVRQFFRCRLLETNRNAARWIHSGKDVADCAVFATSIESLQHDEKRTLCAPHTSDIAVRPFSAGSMRSSLAQERRFNTRSLDDIGINIADYEILIEIDAFDNPLAERIDNL